MTYIDLPNGLILPRWNDVQGDCEQEYSGLVDGFTASTILLTILGVYLTILMEFFAHSNFKPASKSQQTPIAAVVSDPHVHDCSDSPHTASVNRSSTMERIDVVNPLEMETSIPSWWDPHPSPSIRARRLVWTTVLLIPICLCFGFRIAPASVHVRSECKYYLAPHMRSTWQYIGFLNIIPFITAISAWLRAFTDCALVRWRKSLRYPSLHSTWLGWPPFAPICLLFIPGFLVVGQLYKGARWVAGEPIGAEDIELEEESRMLIAGMDSEIGDSECPPAYDRMEGTSNDALNVDNESLIKKSPEAHTALGSI
jgi:hypothetical protein